MVNTLNFLKKKKTKKMLRRFNGQQVTTVTSMYIKLVEVSEAT